jgi:hypothetical protein
MNLGFFAVKERLRKSKGQTFDLMILFQKVPQLKSDFFDLAVDLRPDVTLASVVSADPVEPSGHGRDVAKEADGRHEAEDVDQDVVR